MTKILSDNFYNNLETVLNDIVEIDENRDILKNVDWEFEASNYIQSFSRFFEFVKLQRLRDYGIDTIGVIDICWNEYGGDIEVDFMPSNNFDYAFDDGCILNNHAVDNDIFFKEYFNTDGESATEDIAEDYDAIILVFYHLIKDLIKKVTNLESFKKLPKKIPCHIAIALSHDDERENILSIN